MAGAIEKRVSTDVTRVPLKDLVNFASSQYLVNFTSSEADAWASLRTIMDADQALSTVLDELALEYTVASRTLRSAEVCREEAVCARHLQTLLFLRRKQSEPRTSLRSTEKSFRTLKISLVYRFTQSPYLHNLKCSL
jgi:hypothetical protein